MANDVSAFKAELWSKSIILQLRRINVMYSKVDRSFEGELSGYGAVVKVRTVGGITIGDYVPNSTTLTYQDLNPDIETLTVDQANHFAFKVDDVEKIQTDEDLLQLYSGEAAKSMSEKVDNTIFAVYSSAHADNQISSSGSPITLTSTTSGTSVYDNLVSAATALGNKNAPLSERWAIIDPHTHGLLLKDTTNFNRATASGDAVARSGVIGGAMSDADPGYVGDCAGFRCYVSTALPRNGSTGKYILYGQGKCVNYVSKLQSFESIRLESTFGTAMRGLIVHKAKVFAERAKRLGYIYAAIGS